MAKLQKLVDGGNFAVGDKVLVGTTQEPGMIMFIGSTQFSPGEWVGVGLEKSLGKNDGTVKDVKYFECKKNHGLFVRKTALLAVKQADDAAKAKPKSKSATALAKGVTKIGEQGDAEDVGASPVTPDSKLSPPTNVAVPDAKVAAAPAAPAKSKSSAAKRATSERPSSRGSSIRSPGAADPETSAALTDLRTATEFRDVDRLRGSIQTAMKVGVAPEEIAAAQRILSFESQKALCKEIDKVRNVVAGLAESVTQTKTRVAAAESSSVDGEWVAGLVQRIEQRVWQSLEAKVDERIQQAVRNVAQELLSRPMAAGLSAAPAVLSAAPAAPSAASAGAPSEEEERAAAAVKIQAIARGKQDRDNAVKREAAATKIQAAWRGRMTRAGNDSSKFASAAFAARRRNQAWADIFDQCKVEAKGGPGLDNDAFHKAMVEIHPHLSVGQNNVVWSGYTQGTGAFCVDLAGFCGMAEAATLGDRALAEFADVNVDTFRTLGKSEADAAAVKLQSLQRGKAARAEVEVMKADNTKVKAKNMLLQANADGSLDKSLQKQNASAKDQRVDELRLQARQRLSAANADGRLDQGLQKVTSGQQPVRINDLRARARQGLVAANGDGKLQQSIEKNKSKPSASRVADLKSRARSGLLAANDDGRLQSAIGAVDGLRDRAREGLLAASMDGSLQQSMGNSNENRADAATKIQAVQRGKATREKATVQNEAVVKIQRYWRNRGAANDISQMGQAARKVLRRNKEWCDTFADYSPGADGLVDEFFVNAVQAALPGRASMGQLRAICKGYLAAADAKGVDVVGFVGICTAVATGTDAAAEFAGLNPDTYISLGQDGADEAASKIGAAMRGKQAREQLRSETSPES